MFISLTDTGRFHMQHLRLSRPALMAHRRSGLKGHTIAGKRSRPPSLGCTALSLSVGDTCGITLLTTCRPSYTREARDPAQHVCWPAGTR